MFGLIYFPKISLIRFAVFLFTLKVVMYKKNIAKVSTIKISKPKHSLCYDVDLNYDDFGGSYGLL